MEPLNPAEIEELNELAGALREGTITDQQTERLDQMLADNPAAMKAFAEMMQLIVELQWLQGGQRNQSKVAILPVKKSSRSWLLALAASLVLLLTASGALWTATQKKDAERLTIWKRAELFMSSYPSALLHVCFEGRRPPGDVLRNLAANAPTNSSVSISGCGWSKGRWSGKGAVSFKESNDGLTVSLPGTFKSLTFLSWVRVDQWPATKQQGLLMTKCQERGSLQWYIRPDGTLGLGLQLAEAGSPERWRCVHSPPVIPRGSLGKWIFLACVIDGENGTVSHYYNGMRVWTSQEDLMPLRLGTLGIGNWPADPSDQAWNSWKETGGSHSINLCGRMDEVAILSSALSAEEIQFLMMQAAKATPPPPAGQ